MTSVAGLRQLMEVADQTKLRSVIRQHIKVKKI
ncbi:hypothetical protein EDC39_1062 [Geothermobacter ehrlichii]|uniref:Uncharacterized protein n=1 Tax=Geothermobacter ehrlichii TaxID=213224 RepID=A0A5D3WK11_9BACT|nr:hypothetical protein EDC39_1062 [Geothermobacter ehrlichii]